LSGKRATQRNGAIIGTKQKRAQEMVFLFLETIATSMSITVVLRFFAQKRIRPLVTGTHKCDCLVFFIEANAPMSLIRKIRNLLLLGDLLRGLGTEDARAVRVTNWIQIIFLTITTLLWPQVLLNEPPETLKVSSLLYVEIILFMVIGRIFLYARRFHVSSIITLAGVFIHLGGLCVAYADDPAHYGYFLLMLLPFLLIPSRHSWTRWAFVVIAGVGFLADQVYFRILSGAALFGPPKSVLPADYLMPPMILIVIFYALLINSFVKAVTTAETALAKEHAASERLLLNILPEEIAAELKVKGASDPRYFEATTICFTDFAGFTQIAESMTPTDLVAELDKCFSYFDSVIGRNGLEKLKTIGDSYMFAGGVPVPSPTHAIDSVPRNDRPWIGFCVRW
jgi:hypothetical protein